MRPTITVGAALCCAALWFAKAHALSAQVADAIKPQGAHSTVAEHADILLTQGLVAEAFRLLDARIETDPDDFGARWRAARAALFLGILAVDQDAEKAWYRKATRYAEDALRQKPDDPDALRWAAATEGKLALRTGVPERVHLASRVWKLDQRLLSIAPNDALAHDVRGTLEYEVMHLSGPERIAGRLMGGGELLTVASWSDALAEQERAVALDPGSILYRTDLAATLTAMGRQDEAVAQLQAAERLPVRLPVDSVFKASARRRLARMSEEGGISDSPFGEGRSSASGRL